MAERGAVPIVPRRRAAALRAISSFTSPLLPDDYLELFNPLWSTRELRGRVVRVTRETPGAVTVTIKPGWDWPGHRAGQYVRLGVSVDGVHHWRAYSLTSEPGRADGCIAITPKLVPGGAVSPHLCERLAPGTIVRLGGVEGTFVLPDDLPRRLLFVSAGSGITPIASMLRSLAARGALARTEVVHVHCARTPDDVIFGPELRTLARMHPSQAPGAPGYRLVERHTGGEGRLRAAELDGICPDWRERDAFACGPAGLLDALRGRYEAEGCAGQLHTESFQPEGALGDGPRGAGGTISLCASGVEAHSDGEQPILLAGEAAGVDMPHGCRMGICHSCAGRLRSGRVRDLRTGRVHGEPGEVVRTCVNAPEGAIEIEL
jgi:stearoyl-CoA 9-desaturase NADPH oxidoreductase